MKVGFLELAGDEHHRYIEQAAILLGHARVRTTRLYDRR
jgi:hypothetical protein